MRVAIALSALCTLVGCFGNQEDSSDPETRGLPLEEASPPSAADAADREDPMRAFVPTDVKPPQTGSTPCGPDFKWCPPPGAPLPGPDITCCWNTAKQCYEFAKDPALCDQLVDYCGGLPAPPAPVDPGPSDYEACVIKAKECFAGANDPRECEMHLIRCESLLAPPSPTPYEQCVDKAKDCYNWSEDAATCDSYRERCDALLEPEPPPTMEAIAACYERLSECYVAAEAHPEKCDELRKSCQTLSGKGPQ